MNLPTIIGALIVLAIVVAIIARGVYNRRHNRSSCGCGCSDCPSNGMCHPKTK